MQLTEDDSRPSPNEEVARELQRLDHAERSPGMLRELADFIEFAGELSWESPA